MARRFVIRLDQDGAVAAQGDTQSLLGGGGDDGDHYDLTGHAFLFLIE